MKHLKCYLKSLIPVLASYCASILTRTFIAEFMLYFQTHDSLLLFVRTLVLYFCESSIGALVPRKCLCETILFFYFFMQPLYCLNYCTIVLFNLTDWYFTLQHSTTIQYMLSIDIISSILQYVQMLNLIIHGTIYRICQSTIVVTPPGTAASGQT